jgi:hypothetical protein
MLALMLIFNISELLLSLPELVLQHLDSFPICICLLLQVIILPSEIHQLFLLPLLLLE